MKLYHGTSYTAYQKILKDGVLKPRCTSGGNFDFENVASHPNMIYFCGGIRHEAHFHALHAAHVNNDDMCVTIEVDHVSIDESLLRVDENFLDFEERGTFINGDCDKRKKQREMAAIDHRWMKSLAVIGLCAYQGEIPMVCFSNVTIQKLEDNPCWRAEMGTISNDTVARHRYWNSLLSDGVIWVAEKNVWGDSEQGIEWFNNRAQFFSDWGEQMKKIKKRREKVF